MRNIALIVVIASIIVGCSAQASPILPPTQEPTKPVKVQMTIDVATATVAPSDTAIPPSKTKPPTATKQIDTATAVPAPTNTVKPVINTATPKPVATKAPVVIPTNTPLPPAPPPAPSNTPVVAPPPAANCDPSYPDFCIPPPPPDLDCKDVKPHKKFRVLQPDPHGFDRDGNGIGCES